MIEIRRTVETDYTEKPWRAQLNLESMLAKRVWPEGGTKAVPTWIVQAFGNTPEHALNECYTQVGKRACTVVDSEPFEPTKKESK